MDNDPLKVQPNQPETEGLNVPETPIEPALETAPEIPAEPTPAPVEPVPTAAPEIPVEPVPTPEAPIAPAEPALETAPETPLAEPAFSTTLEEPKEETTATTEPVNFNVPPIEDVSAVEPANPAFVTNQKPKKKSSNILTLVAIFLALCGVGFGIYGMFFQSPKTITKTVEVPGECKEDEEVAKSSKDYIYVGEWGVKIKKPESVASYVVKGNTIEFKDGSEASVSIVRTDKSSVEEGTAEWTKDDKTAYEDEDYYFYAKYNKSGEGTEPTEAETALYNALNNPEIFSVF